MGCNSKKVITFIFIFSLSVLFLHANTHVQITTSKTPAAANNKPGTPVVKKNSAVAKPTNVTPTVIQSNKSQQTTSKPVYKPRKKKHHPPIDLKKGVSFQEIKSHETKKKLVVVEKGGVYDTYRPAKHNDSNIAVVLDTSDFDAAAFANIDFSDDAKEADYYDKKTLEQVKYEIAHTTKPYILYFGASWCIPCRMMRETVFKAHDVKKYLNQFAITFVDVDNFDGMDIKELYKVNNIPYMVIINTQGKQIGRIEGSITSTSFSEKLKSYLAQ